MILAISIAMPVNTAVGNMDMKATRIALIDRENATLIVAAPLRAFHAISSKAVPATLAVFDAATIADRWAIANWLTSHLKKRPKVTPVSTATN